MSQSEQQLFLMCVASLNFVRRILVREVEKYIYSKPETKCLRILLLLRFLLEKVSEREVKK